VPWPGPTPREQQFASHRAASSAFLLPSERPAVVSSFNKGINLCDLVYGLIPDTLSPDDSVCDQTSEVMQAGIVPPHVLAAAVALKKRPGMGGKPGVLKRWHARGATSRRLGESDDFKANSFRIGESELVLALILKTIPVISHAVEALGAQPVAFGLIQGGRSARLNRRPRDGWHHLACSRRSLPVHEKLLAKGRRRSKRATVGDGSESTE
jgi:hypothetical protein